MTGEHAAVIELDLKEFKKTEQPEQIFHHYSTVSTARLLWQ